MNTLHARFRMFGTDLHARSVIINKNFRIGYQAELYQECVVGWVCLPSARANMGVPLYTLVPCTSMCCVGDVAPPPPPIPQGSSSLLPPQLIGLSVFLWVGIFPHRQP